MPVTLEGTALPFIILCWNKPASIPQIEASLSLEVSPMTKEKGTAQQIYTTPGKRRVHNAALKHSQDPESSWAISWLSGMSWMAALIFSRMVNTRLCHFRLQCLLSTSQSIAQTQIIAFPWPKLHHSFKWNMLRHWLKVVLILVKVWGVTGRWEWRQAQRDPWG